MELNKQCTSLEISKRLKELGLKRESLFYWLSYRQFRDEDFELRYGNDTGLLVDFSFSAFTVAELGEMMKDKGMGVTAHSSLVDSMWWCRGGEWIVEKQQYFHLVQNEKWADCLGEMLIYLLENKLIP